MIGNSITDKKIEKSNVDSLIFEALQHHPDYMEQFLRTQNFILNEDGPLAFNYRYFLAIVAATRHECDYLVNFYSDLFLHRGGDHSWLEEKNSESVPLKLRRLDEISMILAHKPWILNKTHIKKLIRQTSNNNNNNINNHTCCCWSLAELFHAIILLAHFHSLSSFVFSCNIVTQNHNEKNVVVDQKKEEKDDEEEEGEMVCVELLMERMKQLKEINECFSQEELSRRFASLVERTTTRTQPISFYRNKRSESIMFLETDHEDDNEVDFCFGYENFSTNDSSPVLRIPDYSWHDHGYCLINCLYNDIGNHLDQKFKLAYNLTYNTMGKHSSVDTAPFRRAVWNYVQCLYGIMHDDYNYGEIGQLLEPNLRSYIKCASCYPERLERDNQIKRQVMRDFQLSEKIHVSIVMFEARIQAELLYALRAVSSYMAEPCAGGGGGGEP